MIARSNEPFRRIRPLHVPASGALASVAPLVPVQHRAGFQGAGVLNHVVWIIARLFSWILQEGGETCGSAGAALPGITARFAQARRSASNRTGQ
jgi:hypothetical protein